MSFLSQPLQDILIKSKRKIGSIAVQVVVNESTNDTLTITKQPVQQGASITDHAFKEPTTFSCTIYFTADLTVSLSKVYQQLLDLQNSRVPFDVATPKRIYKNMLMQTLSQTTDKATENCLAITLTAHEVIIVPVTTVFLQRSKQKNPGNTTPTQPAGKKSILQNGADGVQSLFQGLIGK